MVGCGCENLIAAGFFANYFGFDYDFDFDLAAFDLIVNVGLLGVNQHYWPLHQALIGGHDFLCVETEQMGLD